MASYQAEGIVCSRHKLGDSDRIVQLYSDGGLIRAVAKGSRKPKSKLTGRLEPFSQVKLLMVRGRGSLQIIAGAELIDAHEPLRSSFPGIAIGSAMLALAETLAEHEEAPGTIYPYLARSLAVLEAVVTASGTPEGSEADAPAKAMPRALLLLSAFEIRALDSMGTGLYTEGCSGCGSPLETGKAGIYSAVDGGFLCEGCARLAANQTVTVEKAVIDLISRLSRAPAEKIAVASISGPTLRGLREVLSAHLQEHLELRLKAYVFLQDYLESTRRKGRRVRPQVSS